MSLTYLLYVARGWKSPGGGQQEQQEEAFVCALTLYNAVDKGSQITLKSNL